MAIVKPGSLFSLQGEYPFQMKSQPKYRWWKPIFAGILTLVLFMLFFIVSSTVIYFISGQDEQVKAVLVRSSGGSYIGGDANNPFVMLISFIPLALLIPSVGISMRVFGLGGLRTLSSTEGKLRWKRFLDYVPLTFAVALVITIIELVIPAACGESLGEFSFVPITLLIIVILCPFQCAAEEYIFRGFMFQTFASWIPIVVIPLIIQTLLFTMLHGYNLLGLLNVAVVGVCTAWLTVKTGGLEASISLHSVNNVISFLSGSLFVSQATQTDIDVLGMISGIVYVLILTAVVYLIAKRKGYIEAQRTEA